MVKLEGFWLSFFNFCLRIFFWKDSRLVKPESVLEAPRPPPSDEVGVSSSESESSRDLTSLDSVLGSGSTGFLFLRRMSGEFKNDLKNDKVDD